MKAVKLLQFKELVAYDAAISLQEKLVKQLLITPNDNGYLILLQHQPVITLGRRAHHLQPEISSRNPDTPVHCSNRGGLATFHGPGQLTCYPVINLRAMQAKLSLEAYIHSLARVMQAACLSTAKLKTFHPTEAGLVGLWAAPTEKLGFIGIQAQRWISSHGFSLNVTMPSLSGFQNIQPCGLPSNVRITCLQSYHPVEFDKVQSAVLSEFEKEFDINLQEMQP